MEWEISVMILVILKNYMEVQTNGQMESTMISQRIRHYRRMAKLSQEELADRVDVSETYIRKLEAGGRFPSLDMVLKLSSVLNTTPDHLLLSSSVLGQKKALECWISSATAHRPSSLSCMRTWLR